MTTTWRKELTEALTKNGETWSDIEACTLTDDQLDREFDDSYDSPKGDPFTVWAARHIYFPASYDGVEWVVWVSRHPDGKPTPHIGGG